LKDKTCLHCGKLFHLNSAHQKYCPDCSAVVNNEKGKVRATRYKKAHPERVKASREKCNKNLDDTRREKLHETSVAWNASHPERRKENNRRAHVANKERERIQNKVWAASHPEKEKEYGVKHNAKHRTLGFLLLNQSFPGSEGHHIDKEHVVHIPKEVHRSVWHNIWTGQGMEAMNELALNYLYSQGG
jgi:hypothetical protein